MTEDTVEKIFTVKGLRKRVEKKFDVATPEVSSKIQEADAEDRAKGYFKDGSLVDVDIIEDKDDLIDAFKKEKDGDSSSLSESSEEAANNAGGSGEPPKSEEPPTAAEVVGHWNDPQKTKTTVYGAHYLEKGDELVRREDCEEAVREARRRERQRILDKIEEYLEGIEKEIERIKEEKKERSDSNLNIALMYHRMQRNNLEELRGEAENRD